jgi:phosphatidylinositol-bisphosphatase
MATSEEAASLTSAPGSASASVAVANDDPAVSTSNPHSLHRAVAARRDEYVRPHRIRVKVGTWNVAASPGTDKDLARWFVEGRGVDPKLATISLPISKNSTAQGHDTAVTPGADSDSVRLVGGDSIGLYVLGLQEAADLYGPGLYLRPYAGVDDAKEKWKAALQDALPDGYQFVSCNQLAGLVLLVYASPEVASTISNVSSTTVGTGLMGLLGNKGAVATRIVLGETTRMVFVNCHLASGHDQTAVDRRVWDAMAILARAKFEPISYAGVSEEEGDTIGDADFAFWFGDLNFRLQDLPGDDIRRLLMLHTRGEYDVEGKDNDKESSLDGEGVVVGRGSSESSQEGSERGSIDTPAATTQHSPRHLSSSLPDPDSFDPDSDPHNDPASVQATLDSLLPHDQLRRVIKERKAFHDGWREGPITFPPSYKYDVGTVSLFDSSEKRRAPSWCDRILYRTRTDKEHYEQKVKEEEEARRKDEEMKARGMEEAGDDDQVLFDYDPDNDGDEQTEGRAGLDYDEYDVEGDSGEQVQTKDGALDRLHLDVYTSHQRITSSDHKPVTSVFTFDYDAVVPDLKAKVHAQVAWELDRAENEERPGITIVIDGHETRHRQPGSHSEFSEDAVDLGDVRFRVKQEASVTLANTGRVPASFSFVNSPSMNGNEETRSSSWLTTGFVHPESNSEETELGSEVTLEPGETVKALLIAFIDGIDEARMLNEGRSQLEDVLVLRVKGGRDYFIPVRATWSPTCIGRSLEELIRVPDGGLRAFVKSRSQEAAGQIGSIPNELPVHFAAPKELFRLTEAVESLTERTVADEQMLEECKIPDDPGWPFDKTTWKYSDVDARRDLLTTVLDALDSDRPIIAALPPEISSLHRLEVVSEALLLFLESLKDGIISMPLWARIEQAPLTILGQAKASATKAWPDESVEDDKAAVLEVLSTAPNHNISFVFLTTTLAKIISELAPLSKSAIEALRTPGATVPLGRRSLSFRRNVATPPAEAVAALHKRQTKERRFAEIFARVVCRAPLPVKDRERKTIGDRQEAVMGLFLSPRDDV